MTFFALASEDQNGMAVSPDAFVEVGKPPPSRMVQITPVPNTSDTKASAFIADMLMALIEHQSSLSAMSAMIPTIRFPTTIPARYSLPHASRHPPAQPITR